MLRYLIQSGPEYEIFIYFGLFSKLEILISCDRILKALDRRNLIQVILKSNICMQHGLKDYINIHLNCHQIYHCGYPNFYS